jgi:hypothetical protein
MVPREITHLVLIDEPAPYILDLETRSDLLFGIRDGRCGGSLYLYDGLP